MQENDSTSEKQHLLSKFGHSADDNDKFVRFPSPVTLETEGVSEGHTKDVDKEAEDQSFVISRLTRRSKSTLALLALGNMFAGCGYSLLAPFFPQEAERKHTPVLVTGLIFSTFELVIFLSSPVIGNYLTRLGPKFVFVTGILIGGTCCILFGTLNKCPPGAPFIIICFVCRSIKALGLSAFLTSSFAIISSEFPHHVSVVFGMMETANGIGLMAGPGMGGVLYEAGGFGLPFYVTGGLIILCGSIIFILFPPLSSQDIQHKRKGSIFLFLQSAMVWVTLLAVFVAAIGVTFLDPVFAKFLEQFDLSAPVIGLMFVIAPGLYGLTTPIWGYLTDKKDIQGPLIVTGSFVCGLGCLVVGPSPYLAFLPVELWVITVGLVIIGLTIGCTIIPTMKCLIIGARDLGFESNLDTYAIVSGLFNSVFCLGAFTGPTLSGTLVEEIGFRYATTVVGGIFFLLSACSGCYFIIRYLKIRQQKLVTPAKYEKVTRRHKLDIRAKYETITEESLDQGSSVFVTFVQSPSVSGRCVSAPPVSALKRDGTRSPWTIYRPLTPVLP